MTKRINKILWHGTEVPQASSKADGLDGLNEGELFIKNDPEEPGIFIRTTDAKVVKVGDSGIKLLNRLFTAFDANGNQVAFDDFSTTIASIRANYGLWTEYFLSAKGRNPSTGSSSGGDGASTLGGLNNVADGADVGEEGYDVAKMLVLEANSNLWTLKNLSELVGLDEDALLAYLTTNNYAKKSDIPSLTGYATESWVLGKGYATTSDLDARIDALVNGAPAAYDTLKEIADVLGRNVDSIADILDALGTKANKVDVDAAISAVNASISALNTELSGKIDLKLDAATFNELFEKVLLEDGKTYAIRAKLGLFSDSFLSAKGANSSGGSSSGGAGALYQLADVLADGQQVSGAATGALLMYNGTQWQGVSQSEIVPNLTGYAKLTDIPTDDINKGVTAYGWGDHSKVGYLTGITSALVTSVLGYTPFDSANFTKAKIKSTLGISDWALAASKPSYTTSEVTEGANLYFTNARAVAALKSITDGLGSDISTLQGYFTNGVAKSAARLSTNTVYKAWGQTFFENGVPKAVSGALTDVTDITSSGTITTNKIVIGDGAIEWDSENKGFKIVGGLYTESYLSAKGANSSGSSSSGGQYTRLDEWTNYSSAYDTWVLSAKLGKGLYDTQNSLLTRVGALEGKATNVSFTQSLTSGTLLGTLTIDGASKNIYAPTIPTSDINKGVTSHGWGNHATMGYITASASITGNAASASLIKPTTGTGVASSWVPLTSYTKVWSEAFNVSSLGSDTGDIVLYLRSGVYTKNSAELCVAIDGDFYAQTGSKKVLHEGNYTDYTYSKTTIDSTLSGYQTKITSSNKLAYSLISGTPTSLPASDVYAWAKAATKPSYAFSEITNKPTTLSGYGITDGVTAGAINSADSILTWAQSNPSYIGSINSGGWSNIISVRHRNNQGDGVSYGMLLYSPLTSNGALKYRQQASGNWQDERTILDNISYTDYTYSKSTIDTKLGGYLPLSGGTLSNEAFGGALTINRSGNYDAVIKYSNGNGLLGYIGIGSTREPYFTIDAAKLYTLIHSGNIGSQSVASATKLTTARSIWGQSFDGTGNVVGSLISNTTKSNYEVSYTYYRTAAQFIASDLGVGEYINILVGKSYSAKNIAYIGYHQGANDSTTYLRLGLHSVDDVITINANGNAGIGTASPQYKLDVSGTLHASGAVSFGSTLDVTGAITKPTTSGSNMTSNYISAGGGYSNGTGKYGVKILCCDQADAQTGLGQDLGGLTGGYELSVVGGTSSVGQGYISFVTHGVNSTSYRKLGYFYDNKGVISFDVLGTIHSTTGIWSDGYVSAKGQNTSSDMRLKNVLNEVVLNVSDIANAPSMRFSWKNGGGIDVGSSAQYWQGVLPDAVKERDGMLEMQYANIALLSAIAIAKRVETHEERIERLEREVKELRIENERLKIGGRYAE